MAIAICLIPVLAFAGLAGALSQGWDGASLLVLGGGGGVLLIALFLAPYLRKFGGYTVPDFLGERFGGPGVRPLAVLAVILCSFPALALVLMELGAIAMRVVAVDAGTSIAFGVAMLLVCSIAAGLSLGEPDANRPIRRAARRLGCRVGASSSGNRERCFPPSIPPASSRLGNSSSWTASPPRTRQPLCAVVLSCRGDGLAAASVYAGPRHAVGRGGADVVYLGSSFYRRPLTCRCAPSLAVRPITGGSSDVSAILSFGLIATGTIAALSRRALVLAVANALSYDIYYKSLHLTASTERRVLVARAAIVLVAGLAAGPRSPRPKLFQPCGHDGSFLLACGEHPLAGASSSNLVEARHRRRRSCGHAGQALPCVSITCWRRAISRSPSTRPRASSPTPRQTRRHAMAR